MKLAHYLDGGSVKVGVVEGTQVFGLTGESGNIDQILARGELARVGKMAKEVVGSGKGKSVDSVRLLSPVLSPQKIILIANNYPAHSKEENIKPPDAPYLFTRFNNTLIGPGDPIIIPKVSKKADWEVELAAVIGKEGKYIRKEDALNHVAGYTISNDVSYRDFQLWPGWPKTQSLFGQNWLHGKGMDASFPVGPWLVTSDELPGQPDLEISLRLNGQVKQNSRTGEVIWKVADIIEYVSRGITLRPGDIISTGTPSGIANATGGPFLKDGDIIESTIAKIGTLRNPVKAE